MSLAQRLGWRDPKGYRAIRQSLGLFPECPPNIKGQMNLFDFWPSHREAPERSELLTDGLCPGEADDEMGSEKTNFRRR